MDATKHISPNHQTHQPETNPPVPCSHGSCLWAGCEARCPSLEEFHRHLARSHVLDDKSTAQTKVQIQIVEQLEQQLQKVGTRKQSSY